MKWYLVTIIIAISATGIMAFLISTGKVLNRNKNGFYRTLVHTYPVLEGVYNFDDELQNLELISKNKIRITTTSPNYIIDLDLKTTNLSNTPLRLPFSIKTKIKNVFITKTFGDNIYLFPLNLHRIYRIHTTDDLIDTIRRKGPLFAKAIVLNDNRVIFQDFDDKERDTRLSIWDLDSSTLLKSIHPDPFYHDGGISTDGELYYNKKTGYIAHIHFYYNSLQIIDTTLKIIRSFHTIDTIKLPNIKTELYETILTNAGPEYTINKCAAIDQKFLYVYSKLQADNESGKDFENHEVIDKYSIEEGKYISSFYLPKFRNGTIRNFLFIDNVLYCLTPHQIQVFTLPKEN